jgi:hypothetical protein
MSEEKDVAAAWLVLVGEDEANNDMWRTAGEVALDPSRGNPPHSDKILFIALGVCCFCKACAFQLDALLAEVEQKLSESATAIFF